MIITNNDNPAKNPGFTFMEMVFRAESVQDLLQYVQRQNRVRLYKNPYISYITLGFVLTFQIFLLSLHVTKTI